MKITGLYVGIAVAGLFIVLVAYQTSYDTNVRRSLQIQHPRESSSKCLFSTPRFAGIKVYSQNDEDGILLHLLRCMGGHGKKEYFEFGAHDGMQVNTRTLRDHYGWKGDMMDGGFDKPEIGLHKEYFTPSNIVQLLQKYQVSKSVDVLSVDADTDDFWITREILIGGYRPRILIQEYNQDFDSETAVSVLPKTIGKEAEEIGWGRYYGASAAAFNKMLFAFGYTLVYANGVNLFFVQTHMANTLGLQLPSFYDVVPPLAKKNRPQADMPGNPHKWALIDHKAVDALINHSYDHAAIKKMMEESSVYIKDEETAYYRFSAVVHN